MSCGAYKMNGGAYLAPLSYLNHTYREPSSSAGPHALYSQPGLARPSINATGGSRSSAPSRKLKCTKKHKHTRRCMRSTRRGGFFPPPSMLGPLMRSGPSLLGPATVAGYHMVRNYKGPSKTRKNRK
jgi:hypothetical protein